MTTAAKKEYTYFLLMGTETFVYTSLYELKCALYENLNNTSDFGLAERLRHHINTNLHEGTTDLDILDALYFSTDVPKQYHFELFRI